MKSLDLQPNNINVKYHLGCLYEKIGNDRLSEALANFNEVLIIDPENAPSYNARGLVWDKLENFDLAIKDFTKAMQIDPKNPIFVHNRGCCLRNIEKFFI